MCLRLPGRVAGAAALTAVLALAHPARGAGTDPAAATGQDPTVLFSRQGLRYEWTDFPDAGNRSQLFLRPTFAFGPADEQRFSLGMELPLAWGRTHEGRKPSGLGDMTLRAAAALPLGPARSAVFFDAFLDTGTAPLLGTGADALGPGLALSLPGPADLRAWLFAQYRFDVSVDPGRPHVRELHADPALLVPLPDGWFARIEARLVRDFVAARTSFSPAYATGYSFGGPARPWIAAFEIEAAVDDFTRDTRRDAIARATLEYLFR
jgi:hypothetical protein